MPNITPQTEPGAFSGVQTPNTAPSAPSATPPVNPASSSTDSTGKPTAIVGSGQAANYVNNTIKPALADAQQGIATQNAKNAPVPGYSPSGIPNGMTLDAQGRPITTPTAGTTPQTPPAPQTPPEQTPGTVEHGLLNNPEKDYQFIYDQAGNRTQVPVGQVPQGFSTTPPPPTPKVGQPLPSGMTSNAVTLLNGTQVAQLQDGSYAQLDVNGHYTGTTTADIFNQGKQANADLAQLQQMATNFILNPSEQAQIDVMKANYAKQISDAQVQGANLAGGTTVAMNLYGIGNTKIASDAVSKVISDTADKVTKLSNEMYAQVAQMTQAFKDDDMKALKSVYDSYAANQKERQAAIDKGSTELQAKLESDRQYNLQVQEHADTLIQQEQTRQDAARKYAMDNGITKPFYLVGNTAIDSKTGLPVSLADYQRATGQTVGAPETHTDFSQIQSVNLPQTAQIKELINKYPDAGIQPTDSLADAGAKVKNSGIYRKETYIAKAAGPSSAGNSLLSTVSGQGVVAGVKVPATIANDVEDVLSGRNTLYNIRQTMGRSNAAAAYMQQMRSSIKSVDSKFDFIASDSGGKFVSSTYYQKSAAAINSAMPNIDKVVDLSNKVSRVGVAGVDKLLQEGNIQIGNKNVANFHEAQKLIADEIGLALGQGSVSDMKLQLGFDVTDPSVSPEVFASNMGIVKDFINNRLNGLKEQRYASSVDLGGNSTNTNSSTTLMQGPDGKQYNVPNDKVDAFTKAGGHK